MFVIDDDDAKHAVHPGSAKSAGLRPSPSGRLSDSPSHQSLNQRQTSIGGCLRGSPTWTEWQRGLDDSR
jgi:hypothetical protein